MLKRKHFKNFILCGELESYCLLCKTNVKIKDDHLQRILHKGHVQKSDTRVPQFLKDGIHKVDPYFYCSICNLIIQDIPQIKQHIISDTHTNYKARPKDALARVEVTMCWNDITINPKSTKTVVTHIQWNGIIDKKCVVCNVVVDNMAVHIYSSDHVVNLVQTRINSVGDNYYRKTAWNTFQCFSCKLAYPMNLFDAHFMNHSKHNTTSNTNPNSKWSLEKLEPIFGKPMITCCVQDENAAYPKVLCGPCMDIISKFEWDIELFAGLEDDYLEIDENMKVLKCKTCQKVLKTSAHDISEHLHTHFSYYTIYSNFLMAINNYADRLYVSKSMDHGNARSIAAQYANMNYIKMNAGGSKGYCTLCDKVLSASIEVFRQHVEGSFHRGHLELKGILKLETHGKGIYKPTLIYELIYTLAYSADKRAFLLNKFLMYEDSFFLMKRIQHGTHFKKTKCFACDETIKTEDEKEHCISWKHKSKMLAAHSLDNKLFMREIRPKLYHCGLCNATLPYWDTLEKHSKTFNHLLKVRDIESDKAVCELVKKFGFSRKIFLKTNIDNIYMQLLNAVFNTKYVIKLDG